MGTALLVFLLAKLNDAMEACCGSIDVAIYF